MVGLGIVVALMLMALLAPLIATHHPFAQDLANRLQPPSAAHWFGTDQYGRDIWSRVVYGSRLTLYIVAAGGADRPGRGSVDRHRLRAIWAAGPTPS